MSVLPMPTYAEFWKEYATKVYRKKFLPDVDKLKKVHKLPPKTHETYQARLLLKTWYFDVLLPAIVERKDFLLEVRGYNLATAGRPFRNGSGIGDPYVTVADEAFGLLMVENHVVRFFHVFTYKDEHDTWHVKKGDGKDAIPKYDKVSCCIPACILSVHSI